MRIMTLNVEGLRQASERGFFDWMIQQNADVICLQDMREKDGQMDVSLFRPTGYHAYFFDAFEDSHGGVAIYCKQPPKAIITGMGFSGCDSEGRFIQADFNKVSVVSLFVPSATGNADKQQEKNEFMDQLMAHLRKTLRKRREFIFCGTLNIAHKPIDLSSRYINQKNSFCLPEEQELLDEIFYQLNFCDAFRYLNKAEGQFTWWPDDNRAVESNEGIRLDYQITTPAIRPFVRKASIHREQCFSRHAPLVIDYTLNI
jgi:exodeoxyribonuclease III